MGKTLATIALAALFSLAVIGCNHYSSNMRQESELDKNWGRAFETAKYNQTLNPDAGKTSEPVVGREGPIADRIMTGHLEGPQLEKKAAEKFEIGDVTN
jgi:hypothetical protein